MWHHIFQPLSLWHLCSSSRRGGANTVSRYPPSALVKRGRTAVKGEKEEKHWQDEQQFSKHGVDSRFRPAQPFCSCHQSWNHGVLQVGECVCVCVLPGFKSDRETREKKKQTPSWKSPGLQLRASLRLVSVRRILQHLQGKRRICSSVYGVKKLHLLCVSEIIHFCVT